MGQLKLGNAVGLLAKVTSPIKRYILWAKTDNVNNPNYYEIQRPTGNGSDWGVLNNDGFEKGAYLWTSGETYNTTDNRYAYWDFKLWKSLQTGNQGNQPVEGALWTVVNIREGAIVPEWQAGVYGDGTIMVSHPTTKGVYKLEVVARPFESTDLDAEITSGNWVSVGDTPGPSTNPFDRISGAGTVLIEGNNLNQLITPGVDQVNFPPTPEEGENYRLRNIAGAEVLLSGNGINLFTWQEVATTNIKNLATQEFIYDATDNLWYNI